MKFAAVRAFALGLPEVREQAHFHLTSFRVGGRIFATAPLDGSTVNLFVDETLRAPLLAADPQIYEALHWGAKVVGLRVNLALARSTAVRRLLEASYRAKAPIKLAERLTKA